MMTSYKTGVIRTFVPAKNFNLEKLFYTEIGFELRYNTEDMAIFHMGAYSFYLQNYYVKEWADNFMMFMEVEEVDQWFTFLKSLHLEKKYPNIRFADPVNEDWGRVCRLITPSGVLWHFATFHS